MNPRRENIVARFTVPGTVIFTVPGTRGAEVAA